MTDLIVTILFIILMLIVISVILALVFTIYILYEVNKLPDITPAKYMSEEEKFRFSRKKAVVCIGDSITHGRISENYVRILRDNLDQKYEFVNAGINFLECFNFML